MKKFNELMVEMALPKLVSSINSVDGSYEIGAEVLKQVADLSADAQLDLVKRLSDKGALSLHTAVMFDFNDTVKWKDDSIESVFSRKMDSLVKSTKKANKAKAVKLVPPSKTWYRGTTGKPYGASKRQGYATFVTDNIYQAASYAGPQGFITEMKLSFDKVTEFNSKSDKRYSFVKFDDAARETGDKEAVMLYNVSDNGPFKEQLHNELALAATKNTQNVAFTDGDSAKIVKSYRVDPTWFN